MNKTLCEIVGHIRPEIKTIKDKYASFYECERCHQYIIIDNKDNKEYVVKMILDGQDTL